MQRIQFARPLAVKFAAAVLLIASCAAPGSDDSLGSVEDDAPVNTLESEGAITLSTLPPVGSLPTVPDNPSDEPDRQNSLLVESLGEVGVDISSLPVSVQALRDADYCGTVDEIVDASASDLVGCLQNSWDSANDAFGLVVKYTDEGDRIIEIWASVPQSGVTIHTDSTQDIYAGSSAGWTSLPCQPIESDPVDELNVFSAYTYFACSA